MSRGLPLFDDIERLDPRPQRAGETSYQFIQRVDDPAFARVRALFNEWLDRFATLQGSVETYDLVRRFRSKQDPQFYAAFWELYLHEMHTRVGFEVTVHPRTDRGTRPDFLLSRDGEVFYLEAVMPSAPEGVPSQPGSVRTVLEYIDGASDEDFLLAVRFVTAGEETPRRTEVVAVVEDWLASLERDHWAREGDHEDAPRPEAELPVRDWLLGLTALPRSPARRGNRDSAMIAIYPGMSGWPGAVADQIGPKLDEKASKYGDLDAPYVIACWFMSPFASESTAAQALFGLVVPWEDGQHSTGLPLSGEARRGLWAANRPHRGRVSGVLAATSFDFNYSAVSRVLPRLWLNPWADKTLTADLPYATSRVSSDALVVENVGATATAGALLDLPIDWPGTPFSNEG